MARESNNTTVGVEQLAAPYVRKLIETTPGVTHASVYLAERFDELNTQVAQYVSEAPQRRAETTREVLDAEQGIAQEAAARAAASVRSDVQAQVTNLALIVAESGGIQARAAIQTAATKQKSDPPPKKVNWTGIGKAVGGALVVIGGALGWIL